MKTIIIIGLLLCNVLVSVHAKEQNNPQLTEQTSAAVNEEASETTAPKKRNDAPKQRSVDLETAYKREYAFLEAQRRELIDRLKRWEAKLVRGNVCPWSVLPRSIN